MFVNKKHRKSFSKAIEYAIEENDKQTLSQLTAGVGLNEIVEHNGTTLLHFSIKKRQDKMVKFFIDNGCDVNARDKAGTTPLLLAVKITDYPIIKRLLEANANITLSDNKGLSVLKFILTSHKKNRSKLIVLFTNHFKKCRLKAVELALLMQEAKWPIHYAVYTGNSELIRLMLKAGCDVNSFDAETDYCTALQRAVIDNNIEMIKVLLEHGADTEIITDRGSESLLSSVLRYPKALEAFLDHRNSLLERFNCDGKMESFKTFSNVCYKVIKLLILKYKINLTTKDTHGNTFLHCVILNKNQGIVNLISKIDFDPNLRNNRGDTLLHAVIDYCSSCLSTVQMLIDKGADVNAENSNGDTPLIVALSHHSTEGVLKILIENITISDDKTLNCILRKLAEKKLTYSSSLGSFLKHMAILHVQGNKISERNISLIKNMSDTTVWLGCFLPVANPWKSFIRISEELQKMKLNLITVHSNISVFDIISAPEQKLLYYTQNEKIVEGFDKIIFQNYPIFGNEIKTRFEFATVKQKLIENAIDILNKNIKQLKCNLIVIENIVKYLSLNNLKRLSISCPSV